MELTVNPEAASLQQWQNERAAFNARAEECKRVQGIGFREVPGILIEAAEVAGNVWLAFESGHVSCTEWDSFVADLRASGKVAQNES